MRLQELSSPDGIRDVVFDMRGYLEEGEVVTGTLTVTSQGTSVLTVSSVAIISTETNGIPANKGISCRLTTGSAPVIVDVDLIVAFVGDSGTDGLVQAIQPIVEYMPDLTDRTVLPTLLSYTVASLPSASPAARLIYVSDETGGAVPAFSDGTNWRRMTDRSIVS